MADLSRRYRRQCGFTLIEVFIALTLLGIGLLSLAAMQMTALDYGTRGRHMTRAATIAESQMERLQRTRWTDLNPTGGWVAPTAVNNTVQDVGGNNTEQSYQLSWRIADLDPGQTRTIDVRVTWSEPGRPNRQYGLSSVTFNYEGL